MSLSWAVRAESRWLATVLMLVLPIAIRAQNITIAGTIVDRGNAAPVANARVNVSGIAQGRSDSAGNFRISGLLPGRHRITVDAFGYQSWAHAIAFVAKDTVLHIELEPRAAQLAPMVVGASTVKVKGIVVDSGTNTRVLRAAVLLFPDGRQTGTFNGGFEFDGVPAGVPVTFVAEAIERLPERVELIVGKDTSITIRMRVDSVGVRVVAEQSKRLARRANRVMSLSLDALSRRDIKQSNQVLLEEVILRRLPYQIAEKLRRYGRDGVDACIFLDDYPVSWHVLAGQPSESIDRVEIFGRGGVMIRAYTKWFVAGLIREDKLANPFYMSNGFGIVCR